MENNFISLVIAYNINKKIQEKEIQNENLEEPLSIYPTKSEDIQLLF